MRLFVIKEYMSLLSYSSYKRGFCLKYKGNQVSEWTLQEEIEAHKLRKVVLSRIMNAYLSNCNSRNIYRPGQFLDSMSQTPKECIGSEYLEIVFVVDGVCCVVSYHVSGSILFLL